jgi:cell division transport system permease protein
MKPKNQSLTKKKWGSYPSVSVIFNISVALSVAGFLGLLFLFANELSVALLENLEVKVYLKKDLSEAESIKIRDKIAEMPFVRYENGQPGLRYVSGTDAEKMLIEKTGEDFKQILDFNVLPGTYFVKIKQEYSEKTTFEEVKNSLLKTEGVSEVVREEAALSEINNNLEKIALVMLFFTFIFALASAVLIDNAVRLALYSQRFLIRSMQLVGAEANFIRKPYLQNAALNGILASFSATIMVFMLNLLLTYITEDIVLPFYKFAALTFVLIILGIGISTASTFWAVNKYLKKSLEDLF